METSVASPSSNFKILDSCKCSILFNVLHLNLMLGHTFFFFYQFLLHPLDCMESAGVRAVGSQDVSYLPILHARLHALFTGGRNALNGELSQAASNHRHCSELAAGARVGAVGILSVEPVLRVAAYPPAVVRTHQRHLHPDFGVKLSEYAGTVNLKTKNKKTQIKLAEVVGGGSLWLSSEMGGTGRWVSGSERSASRALASVGEITAQPRNWSSARRVRMRSDSSPTFIR